MQQKTCMMSVASGVLILNLQDCLMPKLEGHVIHNLAHEIWHSLMLTLQSTYLNKQGTLLQIEFLMCVRSC